MPGTKRGPRIAYRSAKTGEFTTKKVADRKPNEHVKETIKPK